MSSQLFPCEVLERIIGHSGGSHRTLFSFSLTCRDLRPRALCLLVADVRFENRGKTFDFCDFLKAKPHLQSLVRSIAINPDDFAPFPLLNILTNLSDLKFASARLRGLQHGPTTVLNRSSLTCCEHVGTHIRTLHLHGISFSTYLEFARLLLAFTNVGHLICRDVIIQAEGNRGPLDAIKRRLSQRLRLLTVSLLARYQCEDNG